MPSPVGHILAGAAVYLAGTTRGPRASFVLAMTLLGSIIPDFDFLPGILIGNMRAFHHGISHSLAFALVFGILIFLVTRRVDKQIAVRTSLLAALAYSSHVILDFVSVNEGTRGVPMLWPLWDERVGINAHLFGYFRYGGGRESIWGVLRWENISPLLRELMILGALLMVLLQKEQIRQWLFVPWAKRASRHELPRNETR